ncbi:MAG: NAD(P)-dependent oxidoreductase [Sphingomonadales bacterium]|nr:NAD(P)-dependent oxidoreductase [Sphingomonadales bacterium]
MTDHVQTIAIIGFGEAGFTFARAGGWEENAHVFDIEDKGPAFEEAGVVSCASAAESIRQAPTILSLVTADAALDVADNAAQHIARGALFFDMNSVAPNTKRAAAKAIEAAGGRYVDVAVMAPVNPARLGVPLFLSGPHAQAGQVALTALGFTKLRIVGEDVGRASTIKMLRSVMYKGVEALTAECLLACEAAGVTDDVLGSFGNDWSSGADYRLDRMMVHGVRRSAEMAEVVKTLEDLGVAALMTRGTVERQAQIGGLGVKNPPEGLDAKLERLKA